jgi:hypothetical protein
LLVFLTELLKEFAMKQLVAISLAALLVNVPCYADSQLKKDNKSQQNVENFKNNQKPDSVINLHEGVISPVKIASPPPKPTPTISNPVLKPVKGIKGLNSGSTSTANDWQSHGQ